MSSHKKFRARLNKDGTITTRKVGADTMSISEAYHWLITASWPKFYSVLTITYVSITLFFAVVYLSVDPENVQGLNPTHLMESFWRLFFFSAQTLSMVGGLGLVPGGTLNNFILTTESMVALSLLTVITGLLFARFSKQADKLVYSNVSLIAPYKDGKALMMRVVNGRKRQSALVDVKADVVFSWYDTTDCNKRNIEAVKLEMKKVAVIPASWTIVHPINQNSPFAKLDLNHIDYEILVRIVATDSITGQNTYSGHAYSKNEVVWNARFTPCTEITEHGVTIVHLNRVSAYQKLECN